MTVPTIGRIVHYKLSADDAEKINRRRGHAKAHMDDHRTNANGVQVHVGNEAHAGDVFPMMITRVWGNDPTSLINGQLFLDGNDLYWVTSSGCGPGERQFEWPQIKHFPPEQRARV